MKSQFIEIQLQFQTEFGHILVSLSDPLASGVRNDTYIFYAENTAKVIKYRATLVSTTYLCRK